MIEKKCNEKVYKEIYSILGSIKKERLICIQSRIVGVKNSFDVCVISNPFNETVFSENEFTSNNTNVRNFNYLKIYKRQIS